MKTAKYVQKQKTRKAKIQARHKNQRRIEARKRSSRATAAVLLDSEQVPFLVMAQRLAQKRAALAALTPTINH